MKSHKSVAFTVSFALTLGLWTPLVAHANSEALPPPTQEQTETEPTENPDITETRENENTPSEKTESSENPPVQPSENPDDSRDSNNTEEALSPDNAGNEISDDELNDSSQFFSAQTLAPMAAEGSILTDQISELALALGVDCVPESTVALSGDIATAGSVFTVNCDVTLDLNGYSLTIDDGSIKLNAGVNFSIDDSSTPSVGMLHILNYTVASTSQHAAIQTTDATLTILGGTIDVTGANGAAGIGGSQGSAAGTLNIYDGTVRAVSISGPGIGGGSNGAGGTTTVFGGKVSAQSLYHVAIGAGQDNLFGGFLSIRQGAEFHYFAPSATAQDGIPSSFVNEGLLYLDTGFLDYTGTLPYVITNSPTGIILKNAANPTGAVTITVPGELRNRGAIGLTPNFGSSSVTVNNFTITYKYVDGTTQTQKVYAPSITSGYRALLPLSTIGSGWALEGTPTIPYVPTTTLTGNITLVEIPGIIPIPNLAALQHWTTAANCLSGSTLQLQANIDSAPSITVPCDLTLDLNGYQLDFANLAQLAIGSGTQLSIRDSSTTQAGTLNISQPSRGTAALRTTSATLVINSGNIIAHGGYGAAAIGGDFEADGGTVIINGGTITAQAGRSAAGIGGGFQGHNHAITITGGTVTATGGDGASGMGAGVQGSGGDITITGGTVTATGGDGAAGIGSGVGSDSSGSLYVTGGKVTATGWYGIGSRNGAAWFVQDGGEVTAIGERSAIGGSAGMGTILIFAGTLRLPAGDMILSNGPDDVFEVWSEAQLLGTVDDPTVGANIRGTGHINNGGVIGLNPERVFPHGVDTTRVNVNHYALSYDDGETATIDRIFAETITDGYRTIPAPTRSGHDFIGWLLPDGETQLSDSTVLQHWTMPDGVDSRGGKTISLTAVWQRNAAGIIEVENGPELETAMGDQCFNGDHIVLLNDITMATNLIAECDVEVNLDGYHLLLDGFNIQLDSEISFSIFDSSTGQNGALIIRNLPAGIPGIDAPSGYVSFASLRVDITGGDGADGIGGTAPETSATVLAVSGTNLNIRGGEDTGNGIQGLLVLFEAEATITGGDHASGITGPNVVKEVFEPSLLMLGSTLTVTAGDTAIGHSLGMGTIVLVESTLYLPGGVMNITSRADIDGFVIDEFSQVLGSPSDPMVGAQFVGAGHIINEGIIGLGTHAVLGVDLAINSLAVSPNHYILDYDSGSAVSTEHIFAPTIGDGYREIPVPIRSGYTFTGWLLPDGETQLSETTMLQNWLVPDGVEDRGAQTITVTAQWVLTPVIVPPVVPIQPVTPNGEVTPPASNGADDPVDGTDPTDEGNEEPTSEPTPTPTTPPTTPTDTPDDSAAAETTNSFSADAWIWWILAAVLVLAVAGGVGYSIRSRRG